MKNYKQEFDRLLQLVKDETPFAFSRFSDGEVTVLRNRIVVLAEDHFIQGDIHGEKKVYANGYMPEEQKGLSLLRTKESTKNLLKLSSLRKKLYKRHTGPEQFRLWRVLEILHGALRLRRLGKSFFRECYDKWQLPPFYKRDAAFV